MITEAYFYPHINIKKDAIFFKSHLFFAQLKLLFLFNSFDVFLSNSLFHHTFQDKILHSLILNLMCKTFCGTADFLVRCTTVFNQPFNHKSLIVSVIAMFLIRFAGP